MTNGYTGAAGPDWAAVITAAGSSARMNRGEEPEWLKKEYRPLPGRFDEDGRPLTVLGAAVSAFAALPEIGAIVITVPAEGETAARRALPARLVTARPDLLFVPGGKTRRASVQQALSRLEALQPRYVLIHDGARPWVDTALIRAVMAAVAVYGAALPLLPLAETPKEIAAAAELPAAAAAGAAAAGAAGKLPGAAAAGAVAAAAAAAGTAAGTAAGVAAAAGAAAAGTGGPFFVMRHLRRSRTGAAQTPQGFIFSSLVPAHQRAAERERLEGIEYTDDSEIWGEFCGPVAVVPGSPENRKITVPEDLERGGGA